MTVIAIHGCYRCGKAMIRKPLTEIDVLPWCCLTCRNRQTIAPGTPRISVNGNLLFIGQEEELCGI